MPHEAQTTVTGKVTDVFGHRFVIQTETGKVLADLGPKGAERVTLQEGDQVTLSGEMKPTELKVSLVIKDAGRAVTIEHKKPHQAHGHGDPKAALQTAKANGFTVLGTPRRKPKHFEILGRDKAGDLVELHIEIDGALRNTRPVADDDPKWAEAVSAGA